jgi:tRNA(Ile2) C34 agmatinyltransferase TiaS
VLQREARTHHALSDENIFDNAKDNARDNANAEPAPPANTAGPYERARAMQQSSEHAARAAEQGTRLVMDNDRSAPRSGIAPEPTAAPSAAVARDLAARSGLDPRAASGNSMEDRGIYSPSEAMREMYDMGDAPSCATCGAIMTRSGSCYRCMSCGSTSGCS